MLTSRPREAEFEFSETRTKREPPTPETLFEAHFESVFRYFSRRISSFEDARDLTADTFAATVNSKVPRNAEPLSWLYGIARRKLSDHVRRQNRAAKTLTPTLDTRSTETANDLRMLIDELPPLQREALLLQVLEELSLQEIAQVMGRSAGSVKALIQRAKEKVRQESHSDLKEMP